MLFVCLFCSVFMYEAIDIYMCFCRHSWGKKKINMPGGKKCTHVFKNCKMEKNTVGLNHTKKTGNTMVMARKKKKAYHSQLI